ncbi:MAG: MotA/TolQ/ExbB proton channel family protein [Candidatus Adiutrix sp.]|jgi:biopolymer transport protein ExbB|nr:MotA/TolQ/ExbB proton channel family protein [Candidatus Adiutrix sp.]
MANLDDFSRLYSLIGPAGVALIILAVMAFFMAVKNFIFFWLVGRDFHKAAKMLAEAPENRDGLLRRFSKNPLIAIIDGVIKTHGQHSDDLKAEVAYLFHRHFNKSQRDLTIIRVVAVIAPLLGLLGTLLGLLGVFQALSYTSAVSTSTVLAAGIWEAIITTIMGLTLAIPTLITYYVLSLKLRSFHLLSIEYGYRFLECQPKRCAANQATV